MTPLAVAVRLVNEARERLAAAERALFAELSAQGSRRPGEWRQQVAECGTPSGYQRHHRQGDVPCYACMAAHRWYETRRKQMKRRAAS